MKYRHTAPKPYVRRAACLAGCLVLLCAAWAQALPDWAEEVLDLPPGPENPRNSEGAFVTLGNGDILFVYTHFTGGASDHATAHLAQRVSADGGRTWSETDIPLFAGEAKMNVMSVSLLRLADGRIALFYLQKNSQTDCIPVLRLSDDDAATWGPARPIVEAPGYYVLNNDRVVQLADGRLVAPLAWHTPDGSDWNANARLVMAISDDGGDTWRTGDSAVSVPYTHEAAPFQEPGLVETAPGKLLMFIRTGGGHQYFARSEDGGDTWGEVYRAPLASPLSPASIKALPGTDILVGLWNDHDTIAPPTPDWRTPLVIGLSADGGSSWPRRLVLEDNPEGWYCYTAMHWTDDDLLLAYCAGEGRGTTGLAHTRVVRIPKSRFEGLP